MNTVLVSIIIPCYNQAQYLDEALQSVYDQTYQDWECIIVNDGSSDKTEEIAQRWIDKDLRFKYVFKVNGGLSSARNKGLNIARGACIQFLDADDCLHPFKLAVSLNYIKDSLQNNIIVTNFKMFKENIHDDLGTYCVLSQDLLSYDRILYGWDYKFTIPIHCGLFSTTLFEKFVFPENLKAKEDWIMWLSIFQKQVSVIFIDETLAFYRSHDESMTKDYKHMLENTIKTFDYLDKVIPLEDYKSYLLFSLKDKIKRYESLKDKVVNSNNSIGFKIEKKIRIFFSKMKI